MNKNLTETGKKLSEVFSKVLSEMKVGKKLSEIDAFADSLIVGVGGQASFKTVPTYRWATCINLNEAIVHGIPDGKVIKEGDVVSLDMGMFRKGWHTDMAYTVQVQSSKVKSQKYQETEKFLNAGKRALREAIKMARVGNRVGDISAAIQETIEGAGYHCVRELTGHGIGKNLHQEPWIPCVVFGDKKNTPPLKEGIALAIEVIYVAGDSRLVKSSDGWTISTADGKISGLFEKTIIVGKKGVEEVTPFLWNC